MQRTKILLGLAILAMVVLAGCTGSPFTPNAGGNPNRNYYVGTRGVIMTFSDPQSPPSQAYYYEGSDFDDNRFNIQVDLRNDGSSYAIGGIYIGGYDPFMFFIEDMQVPRTNGNKWEDCYININDFDNYNNIGGSIFCNTVGLGVNFQNGDNWNINLRSLGETLGVESQFLENVGVSLGQNGGGWDFGINFGNLNILGNSFNNGRAIAFLISQLKFDRFNGRQYELEADTPEYPGGELIIENFEVQIQNWPRGLDQTEPIPFMVTNCYAYSTYAAPQVCIDPNPFDNRRKVCSARRISGGGGTGAPVAITQIDQENTGRKTFFDITIQNVGPGDVYDLFYIERCNPYSPVKLTSRELNKVYLFDARIADQPLDCTPDRGDGIRLTNGRGQIRCSYDTQYGTVGNAYETELVLELGYGYAEFMQRMVSVRRV